MKENNKFEESIFNPDKITSICLNDKEIVEKYSFKKEELNFDMNFDKTFISLKKKFNDFINKYNVEIKNKCLEIEKMKKNKKLTDEEYFDKLNSCTNGLTYKVLEILEIKRYLEYKNKLEEYYCKINCDKYQENVVKLDKCLNKCIYMSKYSNKALYRTLNDLL